MLLSGQESQSLKSTAEMRPKQPCQDKTDSFVHLPDDIILVIFEYCRPGERVECTSVSRLWRQRILQLPVFRERRINLQRITIERTEWEKRLQRLITPAFQQMTVTTYRGINPLVSILSKADCPRLSRMGELVHECFLSSVELTMRQLSARQPCLVSMDS